MREKRFYWILIRALFCALILNSGQLLAYWSSQGDSPRVLQDVMDESLYLRIALDQGRFMPQEAIYIEHAKPLPLAELLTHWRPDQTYSHFLVGRVATVLGLDVQQLNLVLDLVCGMVGYLIFCRLFALILGPSHVQLAELSAVFFLCFPWFSSLESWVDVQTLFPSITAQLGPVEHTVLPIQEGVESQLSTIWFGVTLIAFVACARDTFSHVRPVVLLGLINGLGIYFYVLEWVAATVLIACFIIAAALFLGREAKAQNVLRALVLYGVSSFCAALPALCQIKAVQRNTHIFINDPAIYRLAYYAPVEWIVILVTGTAMLFAIRRHLNPLVISLYGAILAIIAAEICILNLQPLFGVATVGIFIVGCFTRPLLSALVVACLWLPFSRRDTYRALFGGLIVFFIVAAGYRNYRISAESPQDEDALTPLVAFVRQHVPKGSVIAMLTYKHPFQVSTKEWDWRWQPNALASMTGTHLLKEALGLEWGALSPEETISRELALGAVFTGTPRLIRGCAENIELSPKRMFFQQWIAIQLTRRFNCSQARSMIESMTACEALRSYKVDYVVWEQEFNLQKPDYLNRAAHPVWSSESGDVAVLKLDRERALTEFCGS